MNFNDYLHSLKRQVPLLSLTYTIVPNKAPTAAVAPMARAPQDATQTAALTVGAPPASALGYPNPFTFHYFPANHSANYAICKSLPDL